MKTTRYIYTALILAALSQGNAVAQNKGGFFSTADIQFPGRQHHMVADDSYIQIP